MSISKISDNLFVGPQITADQLVGFSRSGFTDVVCNRPDSEHPGGPVSGVIGDAARNLGLTFHYLPITPGEPYQAQAEALGRLMADPDRKILAYCRSGMRAVNAAAQFV